MLAMDIQVMSTWADPAAMPWDIEAAARRATAVPDNFFLITPPDQKTNVLPQSTQRTQWKNKNEEKQVGDKGEVTVRKPVPRNFAAMDHESMQGFYPSLFSCSRLSSVSAVSSVAKGLDSIESLDPAGFDEVLLPVLAAEAVGAHAPAGGRRMDEAAIAEVHSHVRGFLSFLIEKQQVAGAQAAHRNQRGGLALRRGGA